MRALPLLALSVLVVLPSPAGAYKLLGAAWDPDDGPVRFVLHPDGSDDIDDGSDLEAVRSAFRSWSCVEGSRLRTREVDEDGPAEATPDDGLNSIFWDETGAVMMGPATLGVTIGDAPQDPANPIVRQWADIAFNGVDHTWSTGGAGSGGVDVESVAVHEAGHFIGLGHPCNDIAETDCLGPDQAVMTPVLPDGAVIRSPFGDDEDGVREMYPQPEDDESTCEGPFRQGEPCLCNDECAGDLLCNAVPDDVAVCVPTCADAPLSCPTGFACVLGPGADEGDPPIGACVAADADGRRPPAAVCQRDTDCRAGVCGSVGAVAQFVCRSLCEGDDDCPEGYGCIDDVCLAQGATEGIVCPSEPEPEGEEDDAGCACAESTGRAPGEGLFVSLLTVGVLGFRRRRALR